MEKKKSKGKLIALIIAIVVVVGVVTTGIVLAATGTLFGSTKEKAFDLLKQAPEKMTQSAVSKQLGLDELSKAMLEKGMDINYKIKDIQSSDSSVDLSGMEMGAGLSLEKSIRKDCPFQRRKPVISRSLWFIRGKESSIFSAGADSKQNIQHYSIR